MREICTSGSARDGDGNVPIYSAALLPDRRQMPQERSPLGQMRHGPEEGEPAS